MNRAAPLALALLSGCGINDFAGAAGASRTSPWYETDPVRQSHEDLSRTIRDLISRCGYQTPNLAPSADYILTEWEVRMSPHWREGFRTKLEIEVVPGTNGSFVVRSRSWSEVNNNSVAPSDPDRAQWIGAGVTDRHADRLNEPALRFHSMLKNRLFGLNQ